MSKRYEVVGISDYFRVWDRVNVGYVMDFQDDYRPLRFESVAEAEAWITTVGTTTYPQPANV